METCDEAPRWMAHGIGGSMVVLVGIDKVKGCEPTRRTGTHHYQTFTNLAISRDSGFIVGVAGGLPNGCAISGCVIIFFDKGKHVETNLFGLTFKLLLRGNLRSSSRFQNDGFKTVFFFVT